MKWFKTLTIASIVLSSQCLAVPNFSTSELVTLMRGDIVSSTDIQIVQRLKENGRIDNKLKRLKLVYHGLHEFDCQKAGPIMGDYNGYAKVLGFGVQESIYGYLPKYNSKILYLNFVFGLESFARLDVPHGEGVYPIEFVDKAFKGLKGHLKLQNLSGKCLFTLAYDTELETSLGKRVLSFCANKLIPTSFKKLLLKR